MLLLKHNKNYEVSKVVYYQGAIRHEMPVTDNFIELKDTESKILWRAVEGYQGGGYITVNDKKVDAQFETRFNSSVRITVSIVIHSLFPHRQFLLLAKITYFGL